MKLQYMIIIFAIIILPITILLTIYIQSQTDSIALQTKYDTMLLDATYDAVIAFQSNTLNNENSSNKDTLRENISASINVFSNSLSNNLGVGGYSKEYLMPYVPAIAYTMYDGLYIYSPIENLQTTNVSTKLEYEHVLKPYIYYSERIKKEDIDEDRYIDVVINYSLDNYITVYGKVGRNNVAKSGYLLNKNEVEVTGTTIRYKGYEIEEEILSENVSYIKDDGTTDTEVKEYKFFYDVNHQKIYFDDTTGNLFRIIDYKKQYVIDKVIKNTVDTSGNVTTIDITNNQTSCPKDESARLYYIEAKKFTEWINSNIGNKISFLKIDDNNDPENEESDFVQNKRKVIKKCIEDNLNNAISTYNIQSGKAYNFKMPKIKDDDWEQIYRNISIISFLQGIPAGIRTYNNYSVVASTSNKEYIDPKSIYFIGKDDSGQYRYHNLTCQYLKTDIKGYKSADFKAFRKYYNVAQQYWKHSTDSNDAPNTYMQACYYCIVDSIEKKAMDGTEGSEKLKAYYEALARERYNIIKTTQNLK